MKVEPYLFFEGRTEEALEFYQQKLGAKVEAIIRYKENPEPQVQPAELGREGDASPCSASATRRSWPPTATAAGKPSFQGFALTINAADAAEAKQRFDALAEGGQVQMPLSETFFAKSFGMVADRFGVGWMVIAGPERTR